MKQVATVTLIISLALAGSARAATYGWSGLGGNNLWSNGNNWTNVANGSSGTAPGAADDVLFNEFEDDVVALTANTTINKLLLGNGGMMITGAYTVTLNAPNQGLNFAHIGGSAIIDCNLNFANAADVKLVNWNQSLTLNGDLHFAENANGFELACWGGDAYVKINGQLTGYAGGQGWRQFSFAQDDGNTRLELATQHNPWRNLAIRKGTMVLKGNYDAPQGDDNRVGFPSWDGNNPKKIWIANEHGLGIYSNRWAFSPRSTDVGKYHEFRVMPPTTRATLLGRVRIDDKLWWIVDPSCYVEIVNTGIERGDSASTRGVYVSGGGTTDVKVAQIGTYEIPFIISNGVFLANNGVTGLATFGPVTVCAGAVAGGAGGVGALFTESGGIVSPGNSIGTLFVSNNCALAAGTIIDWDVQNDTADLLKVYGTLELSAGTVTVRVHGATVSSATNMLFEFSSLIGSSSSLVFDLSQTAMTGGVCVEEADRILVTGLVPEPGIVGAVALALLAFRRR